MNEFSRSTFPSQGWVFHQPQANWWAPTPLSSTFDQTVIQIIKMRLKNPAITLKHRLSVDTQTVGDELEAYTRARLGIPSVPKIAPRGIVTQSVGAIVAAGEGVADAVKGIKKVASGAALLFEWEESGKPPVDSALANKRAEVCAKCPKNDPQHLSKYFTQPVSEMLRKKLARLNSMNLTTASDSKLGICSACLCPLKLKVFCSIDLILKHLQPDAKKELWNSCWINSEK